MESLSDAPESGVATFSDRGDCRELGREPLGEYGSNFAEEASRISFRGGLMLTGLAGAPCIRIVGRRLDALGVKRGDGRSPPTV